MSSEPVLSVLFLWHQHQPFYKDLLSNQYELPWVRLHATKDYYDMVALLEEFPKIRANFNLVPSLLLQLDDYGQGKAQDKFLLVTLKPAQELSFEDRLFLLRHFFMANWENMIDPYPRYRELLDKRGRFVRGEDLSRIQNYFKEQDWRDLQVWFNLCWFDPYWKEHDDFIRTLYEKGKSFTEEEKKKLVDTQLRICGEVAAKHKELADHGQIEISASPYYHPILPLLCDTESAKTALPQIVLPLERFGFPEDAKAQIQRAFQDHRQRFGQNPQGMWPSEGSVSDDALRLFSECDVRWIAADEAILARSVSPDPFAHEDIYEPYLWKPSEDKSLAVFFRDHELSDAIGFVYTTWKPEDAVADLIKRLHDIRQKLKERDGDHPRPHLVSIILDGENCWEYYREDGQPFLRQLYARLTEDPLLRTVRASDYLKGCPPAKTLRRIWPGSWINANFAIWIGHREDNRAWELLFRTRQFLVNHLHTHPDLAQSSQAALAWEEIYIAEGSDWCWWYGDDHSSANDDTFDYLFRKHLMNVYTVMGARVPDDLRVAIKAKRSRRVAKPPIDFITPQIDGRVTNYFEWQSAGVYQTDGGAIGTMHRAQNWISALYYGYDLRNLYFRLDLCRGIAIQPLENVLFKVVFIKPAGLEARLRIAGNGEIDFKLLRPHGDQTEEIPLPKLAAFNKIIEFAIPLEHLPSKPSETIEYVIVVEKEAAEQERWPDDSTISLPYPTEDAFAQSWLL